MEKNLFEKISAALAEDFINYEEVARILALGFKSNKNVLLWGPGGHGKSEMVELAMSLIAEESDIFAQSFGEGLDEATLWGGLDLGALEVEKVIKYYPEQSFLAKPYAIFEEMFDAPTSVLLALKDTLTARKLKKGAQQFVMQTKMIVANTNRDPEEISELGLSAAALMERFPLQLKVIWKSYESKDYLKLFKKVGPKLPGADLNGNSSVLAEVMAKAGEQGGIISPRTAVHALGIVKTSAALRGSNLVERGDLLDLAFLPGMQEFAETLKQELDDAYERAQIEHLLGAAEAKLRALLGEFNSADTPIKYLQVAKRLELFGDEASSLKVTDELSSRRKQLRETASEKASAAQKRALEETRI